MALPRFLVLYAAMYAAYGVASPFLPAFAASRGLEPAALGAVLGAATLLRLIVAPLAARAADVARNLRGVLVVCIALAACATLAYLPAHGPWPFVAVALLQAAALAPMTLLADALALGAARPRDARGFEYGWVRGAGSAAFIAGTLASGALVAAQGMHAIVWGQALLLACAAVVAARVPETRHPPRSDSVSAREFWNGAAALLRIARFRVLVLVAALVLGSHAMHDAFAMIRWREAGIDLAAASVLWSAAVAAEVVVFFFAGPWLIDRLTPAGALALAAIAAAIRWGTMATSVELAVLALAQPLHGFTFALLHLACMRQIAQIAPDGLAGTAQALYATVGIGAATALLSLASGVLYADLGARAFWLMSLLCALALPLTWRLRQAGGLSG